jgi:hypothetical protein
MHTHTHTPASGQKTKRKRICRRESVCVYNLVHQYGVRQRSCPVSWSSTQKSCDLSPNVGGPDPLRKTTHRNNAHTKRVGGGQTVHIGCPHSAYPSTYRTHRIRRRRHQRLYPARNSPECGSSDNYKDTYVTCRRVCCDIHQHPAQ